MKQIGLTKEQRLAALQALCKDGKMKKVDCGYIYPSVIIDTPLKFKLGEGSHIGDFSYVSGEVSIGNWTIIGPHVYFWSSEHEIAPDKEICTQPINYEKITIGNDVWIGAMAIVTAGITIHDHVVVGANAVVTHDIPEYEIWAGVPAKKIGDRRTWKKQ